MRALAGRLGRWALPVVLAAAVPAALAQTYEAPPSFAAAKIRGIVAQGENYTVRSPVRSDGFLRVYSLETPYGETVAPGDQMAQMRINELRALAQLRPCPVRTPS